MVLITIIVFYKLTRRRIVTSVKGPSEEVEHEFPKKFLSNLKLIYVSFFIYELGSFLTHFLALVLDLESFFEFKEPHYFAIGGVNIFAWVSYLILFSVVDRLFNDLYSLKIGENGVSKSKWKYVLVILLIILLFFYILADQRDFFDRFILINVMVILLIPLVIAQVTNYIRKSRRNVNNSDILIRSRIYILSIIVLILVVGVLIINLIFLPPDAREINWPTRNPEVEFLILYPVFHTLFGAVGIYVIIRLPRWLRVKFGITDEIYYRYQDSRMDYDWRQIDRSVSSYPVKSDVIREESILMYNGANMDELITSFKAFYDPENVIRTDQNQEEFIRKYLLPSNNIVVIANKGDAFIDQIINHVQAISGTRIEFNGDISIHGFKYTLETALFAGFPSIWHPTKSITLLLAKPEIQSALLDFVLRYGEYLNDIIKHKDIYYILKFPRLQGSYVKIPPDKDNPNQPDNHYIDKF
jgi:hypothetical protein